MTALGVNFYGNSGFTTRSDFTKCTVCSKYFGCKSDSPFCGSKCQTDACNKIERVQREKAVN